MQLKQYLIQLETLIDSRQEIQVESLHIHEVIPNQSGLIEGRLRFWNHSLLQFIEVLVTSGVTLVKTDYAYHYQDSSDNLIFRYDNAPHHPEISTHPHHKHIPTDIIAANPPHLQRVLQEIDTHLYK